MDPVILIALIILLIVAIVLGKYMVKERQLAASRPSWPALAKVVSGTAEPDGVKGTYEGKPVRASIKEEKELLMPNPFESGFTRQELGGWVFRVVMSMPPRGQNWTIAYDGRQAHATGLPDGFMDRFRIDGRELDFARVGAGQLMFDSTAGTLTLERYFPIADGSTSKASTVALPTTGQFEQQLSLMDNTAKMV